VVGFNIPVDTLQVILVTIFPANPLTGAKTQIKPNQTATKLQQKKPKLIHAQTKLHLMIHLDRTWIRPILQLPWLALGYDRERRLNRQTDREGFNIPLDTL